MMDGLGDQAVLAEEMAVVGREDDDGVLGPTRACEVIEQLADHVVRRADGGVVQVDHEPRLLW